jgi:hypothetical protein
MPPATHSSEREEERRLSTRTVTIASVASATAAAVTSQLWIAGTWIAAALTPVLVALISELLHRPTERVARAWTADREASAPSPRAKTTTRGEGAAVTGSAGPVRVYRQTTRGVAEPDRGGPILSGRIPWRVVAATAAAAFAIAIAAITTVDLVSGGSVGKGSTRSTFFGGSKDSASNQNDATQQKEQQKRQPQQEQSPDQQQNRPSEQQPTTSEPAPAEQPPTDTAPATPPTESPPGEPVPQTPTSP